MDDEALIVWQDVLDEIAAGRPGNLACPLCGEHPLAVEDVGTRTRVSCKRCGKYIEGVFKPN